ncbi:AlpA family transcriptional regulator [Cryobacterium sp. Y62]|uniref:helix-turn-helix transcriptional regulator n=1 Tax=Cryobacterium sp. Y62 TaxID=2048284 RepID=UPI000CE3BEDE|nr:helix-turn-helix domain-containing protein [Cryobacterium sp. Y62]
MAAKMPLATPAEVAEWLQVTVDRLSKMRKAGKGPNYIKVGRTVRYAWLDVHRWCEGNRAAPTVHLTASRG